MHRNIVLAEDGSLTTPQVHDARVLGLVATEPDRLLIPMRLADGSDICIALNGVVRLRAQDFREGNIVLDLTVSTGLDVDEKDVAALYEPGGKEGALLKKEMAKFASMDQCLVTLNPSYGCTLTCICRGVESLTELPWQVPSPSRA